MSRSLFFDRLSLVVKIGTGQEERACPQRLFASGEVELFEGTWGNDSIADTVDYDRLIREVAATGEGTEFCLLERLGEEIVDRVMHACPGVSRMTVSLWKDPVPVPLSLDRVGVTIRETRMGWAKRTRTELSGAPGDRRQEGPPV